MGNPFINAVYIGHPGWKAMGGRIGYSAATGVMVLVLSWLGIVALVSSLVPVVAILPILLYIGMLIGSQAFQETPRSHAPAIILAMIPQIAAWGKTRSTGRWARRAPTPPPSASTSWRKPVFSTRAWRCSAAAPRSPASSSARSPCSSSTVNSRRPAWFAFAGAVFTFFGLIHAEDLGIAQSPTVSLGYLAVAVMLYCFAKFAHVAPAGPDVAHDHGEMTPLPAE